METCGESRKPRFIPLINFACTAFRAHAISNGSIHARLMLNNISSFCLSCSHCVDQGICFRFSLFIKKTKEKLRVSPSQRSDVSRFQVHIWKPVLKFYSFVDDINLALVTAVNSFYYWLYLEALPRLKLTIGCHWNINEPRDTVNPYAPTS